MRPDIERPVQLCSFHVLLATGALPSLRLSWSRPQPWFPWSQSLESWAVRSGSRLFTESCRHVSVFLVVLLGPLNIHKLSPLSLSIPYPLLLPSLSPPSPLKGIKGLYPKPPPNLGPELNSKPNLNPKLALNPEVPLPWSRSQPQPWFVIVQQSSWSLEECQPMRYFPHVACDRCPALPSLPWSRLATALVCCFV
jgi:hypothetical protein